MSNEPTSCFAFEINERAVGKGRPRFTKYGGAYTPQKTKDFEELVKWSFKSRYYIDKLEPSLNPFILTIEITFEPPKSISNKKRMELIDKYHIKKPDIDNILKAIMDALNGIVYKDDNQIADVHIVKKYGESDKILIVLEEIENGQ